MSYFADFDTVESRKPFKDGLRLLARDINKPERFEDLVRRGVSEVCIVGDEAHKFRNRGLFGSHYFRSWLLNEFNCDPVVASGRRYKHNRLHYKYEDPTGFEHRVRAGLEYLRDFLLEDKNVIDFARFGPCSLYIWSKDSDEVVGNQVSIGVQNYVPGCIPNYDLSVSPDHGGIWLHG